MKTIVLTFAKQFMKGHPKAGMPTHFEQKIMDTFSYEGKARKIHTIRGNYPYWKKRIDQVNNDEALLSLRNWKGKPYRSKQHEFLALRKAGYQRISIDTFGFITVEGNSSFTNKFMANNDGLSENDFDYWFGDKLPFEGIIIHFTDFRY